MTVPDDDDGMGGMVATSKWIVDGKELEIRRNRGLINHWHQCFWLNNLC